MINIIIISQEIHLVNVDLVRVQQMFHIIIINQVKLKIFYLSYEFYLKDAQTSNILDNQQSNQTTNMMINNSYHYQAGSSSCRCQYCMSSTNASYSDN